MGKLMTVEDLADRVNLSVSTIRYWAQQGTGPRSIKLGRRRMYRPEDVEAWLEAQISKESA